MLACYHVDHLTRLVDWHCQREVTHWVGMELEDSHDMALSRPWIEVSPLPKKRILHPTLGSTLLVSREPMRCSSVSPLPLPWVPFLKTLGNPSFPLELHKVSTYEIERSHPPVRLSTPSLPPSTF